MTKVELIMHAMKVLIVEDEVDLAEIEKELISSLGMEVEAVHSPKEAIAFMSPNHPKSFQPDLLVLDISMPGMSGIEFLQKLRNEGNDVMAIFLTAFPSKEVSEKAKKLGSLAFLEKPIDSSKLKRAINEATKLRKIS